MTPDPWLRAALATPNSRVNPVGCMEAVSHLLLHLLEVVCVEEVGLLPGLLLLLGLVLGAEVWRGLRGLAGGLAGGQRGQRGRACR